MEIQKVEEVDKGIYKFYLTDKEAKYLSYYLPYVQILVEEDAPNSRVEDITIRENILEVTKKGLMDIYKGFIIPDVITYEKYIDRRRKNNFAGNYWATQPKSRSAIRKEQQAERRKWIFSLFEEGYEPNEVGKITETHMRLVGKFYSLFQKEKKQHG